MHDRWRQNYSDHIYKLHQWDWVVENPRLNELHASTFTCGTHRVTTVETQKAILWHHTPGASDNTMMPGPSQGIVAGWSTLIFTNQSPEWLSIKCHSFNMPMKNIEAIAEGRNFSQPTPPTQQKKGHSDYSSHKPLKLIWLLMNCMPKSKLLQIWHNHWPGSCKHRGSMIGLVHLDRTA